MSEVLTSIPTNPSTFTESDIDGMKSGAGWTDRPLPIKIPFTSIAAGVQPNEEGTFRICNGSDCSKIGLAASCGHCGSAFGAESRLTSAFKLFTGPLSSLQTLSGIESSPGGVSVARLS